MDSQISDYEIPIDAFSANIDTWKDTNDTAPANYSKSLYFMDAMPNNFASSNIGQYNILTKAPQSYEHMYSIPYESGETAVVAPYAKNITIAPQHYRLRKSTKGDVLTNCSPDPFLK